MENISNSKLFLKARKSCKIYLAIKHDYEMSCSSPFGYDESGGSERLLSKKDEAYEVYYSLNAELAKRLGYGSYFEVYLHNNAWPNLKAFKVWLER